MSLATQAYTRSRGDNLDLILSRLQGVKQIRNDQWMAFDPTYDDGAKRGRQSLSIKRFTDGGIGVYSFAGTPTRDVLAAIGLPMATLMAPRSSASIPQWNGVPR